MQEKQAMLEQRGGSGEDYPMLDNLRADANSRALSAADIRVLIFTVDREKQVGIQGGRKLPTGSQYIHQTVSSLWMCDQLTHNLAGVDLMVGNEHTNYLWWFYRHTAKVTIHKAPVDLNKGISGPHDYLKRNYIRTLKHAMTTDQRGFLICEDDVVFADGFWGYALDAINEMRCTKLRSDGNTLTFYSTAHYIGAKSYYRGRYFCSAGGPFAGLCGIYYDRECIPSLITYLEENFSKMPADLLYAAWSSDAWTRYATPIGLIQHTGGVSAGTSSGAYWTDSRFGRTLKCYDPGWVERPYERFYLRKD